MWVAAIVLKPFVALVLFVTARLLATQIHRVMPESRLKRVLFSPLARKRESGQDDSGGLLQGGVVQHRSQLTALGRGRSR